MKTCGGCKECVIILGEGEVIYFCKEMCITVIEDDGRFCYYYKSTIEGDDGK